MKLLKRIDSAIEQVKIEKELLTVMFEKAKSVGNEPMIDAIYREILECITKAQKLEHLRGGFVTTIEELTEQLEKYNL